jgi:Bacterial Ig-like domain (group 2)
MKRACLAVMSVLMVIACGSDRQFVVSPYTGPTDPTPVVPPGLLSITFSTAPTIGPGETAQMTVIGHYSNAPDRDVTAEATWSSSQTQIATVSAGLVTGVMYGRVQIRAIFGGRNISMNLVIKPAGTFILSGNITEAGPVAVGAATVSVVNGPPNQVTANAGGFYELFGVSGTVTLRVSKQGYVDQNLTVTVMQDQRMDVQIKPISAPIVVGGTYRMTLTISPSCTAVPDDIKTRIYTALIAQDNALVKVQLSDANFGTGGRNAFTGRVSGSTVTFDLGTVYGFYYYYGPTVQEILPDGQTLGMWGTMVTTSTAQNISGNLAGGFTYREGRSTKSCTVATNSVVLTRK